MNKKLKAGTAPEKKPGILPLINKNYYFSFQHSSSA
jgi:hypothetical protein